MAWARRWTLMLPRVPALLRPLASSPVMPNGTERALLMVIFTLPMVWFGVSAA
ncbi:hypothetical protein [Pseudomonas gorinensis]